jgi:hypothetical protein
MFRSHLNFDYPQTDGVGGLAVPLSADAAIVSVRHLYETDQLHVGRLINLLPECSTVQQVTLVTHHSSGVRRHLWRGASLRGDAICQHLALIYLQVKIFDSFLRLCSSDM